ncbi:TMEM175 family protein [Flavivirga abyssicola]|uniref:TMEM175 family protein n=1 Tax=Flavivirga abyssicola TaxID=3063533 RepID=UPI0026E0861B|nr:TMEM175 family protein [Flavivirga sp. MEBiC07777]WVK13843.1 TMEM175 family protein [Flavivirga sp. MEBiC07777]
MKTNRLEAFSDGVLAIVITIMVLELKTPHEANFEALLKVMPIFLSYLLSFIYIGIYWNNHHHLFQITERVNGKILWSNLHLLFWLSLIPFTTSWIGESHFEPAPIAFYGIVLLMSALAYNILQIQILKHHDENFVLRKALGKDIKGKISIALYVIGVGLTFFNGILAILCYIIVAIIWFIPEKRIEQNI